MQILFKFIVPILLCIGAVYLIGVEILNYPRLKKMGIKKTTLKARFLRRTFGAFVVIAIAVLVAWGLSSMWPPVVGDRELLNRQLAFWSIIGGLVFLTILLALWDALEGVRHIEKLIEKNTVDEMLEIRKTLSKKTKEKSDSNNQTE
ncbi:MAG: hypothetical protein LWY06_08385 [Firmicutes bacterium]|nr:hypothetical protein [Bacillota bacterium]